MFQSFRTKQNGINNLGMNAASISRLNVVVSASLLSFLFFFENGEGVPKIF